MSSLNIFKKKNKRSQIFIIGSAGAGKSSLIKTLCASLSMTDKGTQTVAGIELETIKSAASIIYSYNFDKSNFSTITKFISQTSTKCVIFVIDSRKQHIIKDSHGNDIRSNIKAIGKVVTPGCHIMVLCNKQDVTEEAILSPDEIKNILDIDRIFSTNPRVILGTVFSDENPQNTDTILSYLSEHNIAKKDLPELGKKRDSKSKKAKKKMSFSGMFQHKSSNKKEVVMILGLDKVGKTKLMDSFGFGKRSTTSIALFEAEMLKGDHLEMYDWNYEQRSWPMAKSFFANCSLLIFVIDGSAPNALCSEKKNVWTVELYLKKLLSIGVHDDSYKKEQVPKLKASHDSNDDHDDEKKDEDEEDQIAAEWPLMGTPILIYLNKSDLDGCTVTTQDLEEELHLSKMMKYRGMRYRVQECSAKTKEGVYDGLIWCRMNGLLNNVAQIKEYADKHEIKLPMANGNVFASPSPSPPL